MAKDGNTLMDEAAEHPTLDEVMRRDPKAVSREEMERFIAKLKEDRAQFIKSKEDK